jgi:hypothetical protein
VSPISLGQLLFRSWCETDFLTIDWIDMNRQTSGIIYELRCCIDNEWHPFYVGRTSNQRRRLNEHRTSARTGTTLVYQFIREELEPLAVAWDLFPVEVYSDDYVDQEDEHIMALLYDGTRLKNMKKGDAEWMTRRVREAEDMVQRGIRSYRKYKEIISLEEATRKAEARHNMWIESDPRRQQASDIMAAVRQTVGQQATQRQQQEQARQARAQKREAAVKATREKQKAAWESTKEPNNYFNLFEIKK